MSSTIIGIDIGSRSLKLSMKSSNKIQCFKPFPLPDNLVKDNHIVSSEVMASVIKQAVKINHIHTKNCAVILPADTAFIRHVTVPVMTAEQLKLNLPFEFNDYIQKDKDLYYYDYAVEKVTGGSSQKSEKLDLIAAAVQKKTISEYFQIMSRAGLKIKTAIPEIFSYRNLIINDIKHHPEKADKEYCIIDLGYSSIRMHIYNGTSYETTRIIDYSGRQLIDIVMDTLKVDSHIADAHFRVNHDDIQSCEPCVQFYRSIAVEIKRAIDFYSYYKSTTSIDEIYYCGGLSYCNELIAVLRKSLDNKLSEISSMTADVCNDSEILENHLAVGALLQ